MLGFCGFAPVRTLTLGPVGEETAPQGLAKWETKIAKLARTIQQKTPAKKVARLAAFLGKDAGAVSDPLASDQPL